ncbi:hypothetical protein [Planctopirus hydrillae]|nr:hypothetical protein [Planctopirus hydrillae]
MTPSPVPTGEGRDEGEFKRTWGRAINERLQRMTLLISGGRVAGVKRLRLPPGCLPLVVDPVFHGEEFGSCIPARELD